MRTIEQVLDYLDANLALFDGDPASSNYQDGYEEALKDLKDFIER